MKTVSRHDPPEALVTQISTIEIDLPAVKNYPKKDLQRSIGTFKGQKDVSVFDEGIFGCVFNYFPTTNYTERVGFNLY